MEPTRESHEALEELERYGDTHIRADIQDLTSRAQLHTPGLVGVTLSLFSEGLVLTYVASELNLAALDGVQYADDGPCLEAIREDDIIQTDTLGLLDEGRWALFARSSAAAGISSTLSMPFRRQGIVTGGVNLYGGASDTFDGKVEDLAALFGAWAPGAVTNADLSFTSRLEAVGSPRRLRERTDLDKAIGLLVGARGISPDAAEERLTSAAARAGVTVFVLARALVEIHEPPA